MNKNTMIAMAGVLLAVIGCFLPWETLGELSLTGMDDLGGGAKPGMIVIGIAVVSGICSFLNKKWASGVSAALALLLLCLLFLRMGNIKKEELSVGMGLYIVMLGCIVIVAGNIMSMMAKKPTA